LPARQIWLIVECSVGYDIRLVACAYQTGSMCQICSWKETAAEHTHIYTPSIIMAFYQVYLGEPVPDIHPLMNTIPSALQQKVKVKK